jgi:SRSO17 transposase
MAMKIVFSPYILVIVYLSVENNGEMFKMHRLFSSCNIKDREAMMMKYQVAFCKSRLLIRSPVKKVPGQQWNIERVVY